MALLYLLAAGCSDATAPPVATYADGPADAQLVTSDIENFWRAYDIFSQTRRASAFQVEYLDRASPGLNDFIQARSLTATRSGALARIRPGNERDEHEQMAVQSGNIH